MNYLTMDNCSKLCIDCAHHKKYFLLGHKCLRLRGKVEVDIVSGKITASKRELSCESERLPSRWRIGCGPDAKHFKSK